MKNEYLSWPCKYCGERFVAGKCPDMNCPVHLIEKREEENMRKMTRIIEALKAKKPISFHDAWVLFVVVLYVFIFIAIGGSYLLRWLA